MAGPDDAKDAVNQCGLADAGSAGHHDDLALQRQTDRVTSWAFSEAAEFARRYDDKARAYYNRRLRKSNFMVAHTALAHKLARAAYHIMRDHVPFMPDKIFT